MSNMNPFGVEAMHEKLEGLIPTEAPVKHPMKIDFGKWRDEGVQAIAWDSRDILARDEGMLGSAIEYAKREGIEGHILLAPSPMAGRQAGHERNALNLANEVGIDYIIADSEGRGLYRRALDDFGLSGSDLGMVSSSASSIRAAGSLGVMHRSWVRPADGSNFINPLDVLLRFYSHVNYGTKAQVNDVAEAVVNDNVVDIFSKEAVVLLDEAEKSRLDAFLYEHGRSVADALTYSRLVIAGGVLAVSASKMPDRNKQLTTAGLVTVAYLTDYLDGKASRRSKDGETVEGAKSDQEIDKILSTAVDLVGLLPQGLIGVSTLTLVLARDVIMTRLRGIAKEAGMQTKSVRSGKDATMLKGGSQIFGLTLGKRFPVTNQAAQASAVALKLTSMISSIDAWNKSVE